MPKYNNQNSKPLNNRTKVVDILILGFLFFNIEYYLAFEACYLMLKHLSCEPPIRSS